MRSPRNSDSEQRVALAFRHARQVFTPLAQMGELEKERLGHRL
jgi:hypothetical protein